MCRSTATLSGDAQNRYTQADGFPVITSWDDPLQYYCQNNAFLGIGDVYTHRDKNLKGNTLHRRRARDTRCGQCRVRTGCRSPGPTGSPSSNSI